MKDIYSVYDVYNVYNMMKDEIYVSNGMKDYNVMKELDKPKASREVEFARKN